MANICSNTFFASSNNKENIEYVSKFLIDNLEADVDEFDDCIDAYFDSKWTFPEKLMDKLYEGIPDKSDIYMHCLSVEYGLLYHALHVVHEHTKGWEDV